jgi:hypothetical protein
MNLNGAAEGGGGPVAGGTRVLRKLADTETAAEVLQQALIADSGQGSGHEVRRQLKRP